MPYPLSTSTSTPILSHFPPSLTNLLFPFLLCTSFFLSLSSYPPPLSLLLSPSSLVLPYLSLLSLPPPSSLSTLSPSFPPPAPLPSLPPLSLLPPPSLPPSSPLSLPPPSLPPSSLVLIYLTWSSSSFGCSWCFKTFKSSPVHIVRVHEGEKDNCSFSNVMRRGIKRSCFLSNLCEKNLLVVARVASAECSSCGE